MIKGLASLVVLGLLMHGPAAAQLADIPGWQRKIEAGAVVYSAPGVAGKSGMTLTLPAVEALGPDGLEPWFKSRVAAWVKGRKIYKQNGVQNAAGILSDGISLPNAKGKGGDLYLFSGWKSRSGAQFAIEFLPEHISQDDQQVRIGSAFIASQSQRRLEVTPAMLKN